MVWDMLVDIEMIIVFEGGKLGMGWKEVVEVMLELRVSLFFVLWLWIYIWEGVVMWEVDQVVEMDFIGVGGGVGRGGGVKVGVILLLL